MLRPQLWREWAQVPKYMRPMAVNRPGTEEGLHVYQWLNSPIGSCSCRESLGYIGSWTDKYPGTLDKDVTEACIGIFTGVRGDEAMNMSTFG